MPAEGTAVQDQFTFASEEERDKALAELPEDPPHDVGNVDNWLDEIDRKRESIMAAKVTGSQPAKPTPGESSTPAPAEPTQSAAAPAPAQQSSQAVADDDFIDFGRVKRSELPEILRPYKTPGEIFKTAEHARRYANATEERLKELNGKIQPLEQKAGLADQLSTKVRELEARIAQAQIVSNRTPQTPVQRAETQRKIDELRTVADELNSLKDDDPELMGFQTKAKTAITLATAELNNAYSLVENVKNEFSSYREESQRRMQELNSKLDSYVSKQTEAERVALTLRRHREAVKQLEILQGQRPELKTSKPLISESGACVETDVKNFANKVMLASAGRECQTWDEVNRIATGYLMKDPTVLKVCEEKGVTPDIVGTSENDMRNYAISLNIDALMRGEMLDEYTGKYVPVVNKVTGARVVFPDQLSAYNWLREQSGIAKREIADALVNAEKRGQQSVLSAAARRDLSAVVPIGNDGAGSPENIGENMDEKTALNVVNSMDEEELEMRARRGDRTLFHLYNKAQARLKLPLMVADDGWPAEKSAR